MGSVWRKPSRRDPNIPQVEACEVCGKLWPSELLVEGTAQGLAGVRVCSDHKFLTMAANNPSYLDYGGPGNLGVTKEPDGPHAGDPYALVSDEPWQGVPLLNDGSDE